MLAAIIASALAAAYNVLYFIHSASHKRWGTCVYTAVLFAILSCMLVLLLTGEH